MSQQIKSQTFAELSECAHKVLAHLNLHLIFPHFYTDNSAMSKTASS